MTLEQFSKELQQLGVSRFCFRVKSDKFEAMIINKDGDVFGVGGDTIVDAAATLLDALKAKTLLGSDGWNELLNPNLN